LKVNVLVPPEKMSLEASKIMLDRGKENS